MDLKEFEPWLTDTLINIDEGFDTNSMVTYIHDILKTEDDDDERKDAMSYLFECQEKESPESIVTKIIEKYKYFTEEKVVEVAADAIPSAEFDLQLADIMRRQAVVTDAGCRSASTTNGAGLPANSDKAAILAQYAACEVSDDEDDDDDNELQESENTNTKKIEEAEKMKRERLKNEYEARKQKNKEDSEKQAQKAKERKEKVKEKTQKGERRR